MATIYHNRVLKTGRRNPLRLYGSKLIRIRYIPENYLTLNAKMQ